MSSFARIILAPASRSSKAVGAKAQRLIIYPEYGTMANKHLRILITENLHREALWKEQMLNQLGYFRIAVASSLQEMRILGRCTSMPFDVMISSSRLLNTEPLQRGSTAGVYRNALFYDMKYLCTDPTLLAAPGTVVQLPGPLGIANLDAFMALVSA